MNAKCRGTSGPMAMNVKQTASRGLIPKSELRKIKQRVAKLRNQGHDIWTDDEVSAAGYTTEVSKSGLHVEKERQQESWDCGLACVQMVLGVLTDNEDGASPATTYSELRSRIAAPSVWTIDLAYLLSEWGVQCEFLTLAPELDLSAYRGNGFYEDGSLEADARRVDKLLRSAPREGIRLQNKSLSAEELWNLMREEETLVIALVDARQLHARVARTRGGAGSGGGRGKEATLPTNGDPTADASSFMGHYVLLLGLDDERNGFVVNDPARDDERTFVPAASLEAARRASGTDEDLLLISAYQDRPTPPAPESVPKIVRVGVRARISKAEAAEEEQEVAPVSDTLR